MTLRFAWVTNIPAPYRNHQFERMRDIFPRHGIEFEVHFLAWTDPRRSWNFAPDELHYPWVLHKNPLPSLARRGVHVNPGLIASLWRHPVDIAMIGGWGSPTHALAPFLLPRRTLTILGSESHADSLHRRDGVAHALKRQIVHRYDAFLVPGTRARALLCALDPDAATKPWVMLPNLVDARVFRDRVATLRRDRAGLRARLGVAPETQLWFCPARLAPEKGLRELLPLLAGRTGLALWIAGEGPLRAELDAMVARDRLPVRLLGQQPEETITELYAAADLFVLPSLSDPSPLSAVEAASAQLPLLLSTHAGNSDELIEHGVNGWRFDVDGGDARRALLDTVAATPASTLAAMGLRAGERYRETFDSDVCVERLARFLVELHADARSRATTRRQ